MTETDDPKVKEHLKGKHEQRLKRLSELELNTKDLNNYFESREIKPVIILGRYDVGTDKYILGPWRETMTSEQAYTTASAASLTLTCAAGHRYKVYLGGAQNATQASTLIMTANIGGQALNIYQSGGGSSTVMRAAFGASMGSTTVGLPNYFWLDPGDTLTVTLSTYNNGVDNTEHFMLYEDYTI